MMDDGAVMDEDFLRTYYYSFLDTLSHPKIKLDAALHGGSPVKLSSSSHHSLNSAKDTACHKRPVYENLDTRSFQQSCRVLVIETTFASNFCHQWRCGFLIDRIFYVRRTTEREGRGGVKLHLISGKETIVADGIFEKEDATTGLAHTLHFTEGGNGVLEDAEAKGVDYCIEGGVRELELLHVHDLQFNLSLVEFETGGL
jgi:hypothetical protein